MIRSSDWLQHMIARDADGADALEVFAEHGRTQRIRNAAEPRRARICDSRSLHRCILGSWVGSAYLRGQPLPAMLR